MPRIVAQIGMVLLALLDLVIGVGLYLDSPWATWLWPWTTQPLDRVVLSSFLAAGVGTVLWIGLTREWGALTGALLDVGIFHLGAAAWSLARWWGQDVPSPNTFGPEGAAAAMSALGLQVAVFFGLFVGDSVALGAVWRRPLRDIRPADPLLIRSFQLFAAVLLLTGVLLLLHQPIWPWPLSDASATLFGLLFLGSAAYFVHGLLRPTWHRMKGQLIAFLLYDAVLVQPYLRIEDARLYRIEYTSLAVYWAVILYSGGLAIYYLFLNPRTRGWRVEEGP